MRNNTQQKLILLLLLLLQLIIKCESKEQQIIESHSQQKHKIAFGSCNKFYRNHKSNIFYDVAKQNPDVWIWLGDVAYIDQMYLPGMWVPESNFSIAKSKLDATKFDPAYQEMLKRVNGEIGVWDDHDYGSNNAGDNFKHKQEMRQVWLDFFNEPKDSPRRTRDSGIYTSYYLGQQKRIKIILTDVRYNRQKNDILGEKQWVWLEEELSDSQVELFILGTGSQFLPDDRFIPEHWDIQSKERLYKIINKTHASLIFISGDVHYAELMEHPCSSQKVGYKLAEITSSGLSFSFDSIGYGQFAFANEFVFTPTYNDKKDRFSGLNYGIVEVEWDEKDIKQTTIRLQIYTINNPNAVLERVYNIQEFQRDSNNAQDNKSDQTCVVDEISAFKRWNRFALKGLKNIFIEFNVGALYTITQAIVLITLLISFYKYLIVMVFFYDPYKNKTD